MCRLYHDETYELRWLPRPSSSRAEVRSAWSRVVQPQEQHPDNQTDDVRRFAQVLGQWRDAVRPSLGNRGWKAAGLGVKTHPLLSLCMDPSLRLSLSTRRQALTAFTADTVKVLCVWLFYSYCVFLHHLSIPRRRWETLSLYLHGSSAAL